MPLPSEKTHYTFADLQLTEEHERIEIIHGYAYFMRSGTLDHQQISGELLRQFANFLDGKSPKILVRPLSVRLFEKDSDTPEVVDTVVEPDLLIVHDKSKFDEFGCKGVPDLIIEILEPYTYYHDCFVKLDLYQQAGVREYWIVDPESKTVKVLTLDDEGIYHISKAYKQTDTVKVNILNGCTIDLSKVFPEE
ncbi:MAG: Uma2 family endonuclease [Oscillospiraceae bacterium]|nr:Uma2 family endonuclease [Oscillospiraceae bacterium]